MHTTIANARACAPGASSLASCLPLEETDEDTAAELEEVTAAAEEEEVLEDELVVDLDSFFFLSPELEAAEIQLECSCATWKEHITFSFSSLAARGGRIFLVLIVVCVL